MNFDVQSPDGTTLTISGDAPPTESQLKDIFKQAKARTQTTTSGNDDSGYIASSKKVAMGFPGAIAEGLNDVMIPVRDVAAKTFTALREATAGDNPLSDYKPAEIKPGVNMIDLPQVSKEDTKLLPKPLQVVAGVANAINSGLSSLTEPGNALIAPVAGLEGIAKPLAGGFLAQTLASEPKAVKDAWDTYHDPKATTSEKSEAIATAAVVNPAFAALLAHGIATKPEVNPSLTPLTDEALKQTTGEKDAKTIRSDTGQLGEARTSVEGSQANSGNDLQQTPPEQPIATGQAQEEVNKEAAPVTAQPPEQNPVLSASSTTEATTSPKSNVTTPVTQSDFERYQELTKSLKGKTLNEAQAIMGEVEAIKNRNGGKPPLPPQSQPVETSLAEPQSALSPTPPAESSASLGPSNAQSEGDTYGIAERVRAERAAKGQVEEIPPGEGVNAPDSIQKGRDLISNGVNPESVMLDFEKTKKISADEMAVARAHGEMLNTKSRQIERQFGHDSPEFKQAFKDLSDWDKRSKAMQTEWHKSGMAQQGETDVDTGSFTGLQRAFSEDTGKEFSEPQAKKAKTISESVSKAEIDAQTAEEKLNEHLSETTKVEAPKSEPSIHPKIIEIANNIVANLDKRADAARARIKARAGQLFAGVDPTVLLDVAEIGASHLAHIGKDFAKWSLEMVKEFGEKVKPHLDEIYKKSNEILDGIKSAKEVKRVVSNPESRALKYTPETRAIAAANRTVRDAAIRLADAENKSRLSKSADERALSKVQEVSERRALDAAKKTVRDMAIKAAKEDSKARVKLSESPEEIQDKATQDALDIANKVARDATVKMAEADNAARQANADSAKEAAQVQAKASKKALDIANNAVRDASIKIAQNEAKNRANPEIKVWSKVREYLEKGEDSFDEIRSKVATELGVPIKKVTDIMTRNPRAKYLANEAWKKQQDLRRLKNTAKRWLKEQQIPKWQRAIASVPRTLFALKVGFHGTVALGTHAPMVAFQPTFWKVYIDNFGRMYKMVGSTAFYENQVQDLLRNNNYITARRAGLVNDPYTYEDFNSPAIAQHFGNITGMGNRGYAVLKMLRQDMFDQHWNQLPKTSQISEVAQAIADGINHSTGVTKKAAPGGVSVALFAPRLEASRVAWLAVDPAIATKTFLNWKNSSIGERTFAVNQLKEKAWVAGTLFSLLAANQGILSATNSKQKINVINPMKSDFMKFKIAGMNLSYGNAMISMARLPARLFVGVENEGKLNKIVYEDENTAKTLFDYTRSQASPFAGLALDLGLGRDFEERPLPRSGFGLLPGKTNMPKRLKAQGTKPYTWTEYLSGAAAPIPAQEAIKEVWKHGLGMSDEQINGYMKALAVISFDSATGGRLTEDYDVAQ